MASTLLVQGLGLKLANVFLSVCWIEKSITMASKWKSVGTSHLRKAVIPVILTRWIGWAIHQYKQVNL